MTKKSAGPAAALLTGIAWVRSSRRPVPGGDLELVGTANRPRRCAAELANSDGGGTGVSVVNSAARFRRGATVRLGPGLAAGDLCQDRSLACGALRTVRGVAPQEPLASPRRNRVRTRVVVNGFRRRATIFPSRATRPRRPVPEVALELTGITNRPRRNAAASANSAATEPVPSFDTTRGERGLLSDLSPSSPGVSTPVRNAWGGVPTAR